MWRNRLLCFLVLLISSYTCVQAGMHPAWYLPFLSHQHTAWNEADYQSAPDWFDCSEDSALVYCSDLMVLHQTEVWAQSQFDRQGAQQLTLSAEFSVPAFNALQLGLRQDGFQLSKVEIGDTQFDVEKKLQSQPAEQVDREVLLLLQSHTVTSPRTLYWRSANSDYQVRWYSDGEEIALVYY